MHSLLRIYLQNHEAAARGGLSLFRRAARGHRRGARAAELDRLADEVAQDRASLRLLMRELDVSTHPVMATAIEVGERLGRLKPNGRLLRRSPLSDLVEVEAAWDAVHAKRAGWIALRAAGFSPRTVDLDTLVARADDQLARLEALHHQVSAEVLRTSPG